MSDPVFSPDGKWMWTGKEWVPAPPSEEEILEKPIFSYSDWEKKKISKDEKYVEIILKFLQNEKGEPISKEEIRGWMKNHYKKWIREKGIVKKIAAAQGKEWKSANVDDDTVLWNNNSTEVKIQIINSSNDHYSNLVISFYKPSSFSSTLKKNLFQNQKKVLEFNKQNKNRKERRAYIQSLRGNKDWGGKEAIIKRYPSTEQKSWFYKNITRYWWDRAPEIQKQKIFENVPMAKSVSSGQHYSNESNGESFLQKQRRIAENNLISGRIQNNPVSSNYTYTCISSFCGFSETYNRIHPGKKCSKCGKPMNRN